MILTADDPSKRPDPLADVLSRGVGTIADAVNSSIDMGKVRTNLQNQQGGQFFDLLREESAARARRFELAVGTSLKNRDYTRGVQESDRNFNRAVETSDRAFSRGVLESDRTYNYGVARDKVADAKAAQSFALQSFQVGNSVALSQSAEARAAAQAPLAATSAALEVANKALTLTANDANVTDALNERDRREEAVKRTESLFNQGDAGYTPKPEVSSVTLQDYVANNQGIKDDRIQGAVGAAGAEISRRQQASTQQALTPEVEALRREIGDLNSQLAAADKKADKTGLNKRILDRQERLDEIVEKFPALGRKTGLTDRAVTDIQSLIRDLGISTVKK